MEATETETGFCSNLVTPTACPAKPTRSSSTPFDKWNQPPQAVIFSASNSSICARVSPHHTKPRCKDSLTTQVSKSSLPRLTPTSLWLWKEEQGTSQRPLLSASLVLPPTSSKPIPTRPQVLPTSKRTEVQLAAGRHSTSPGNSKPTQHLLPIHFTVPLLLYCEYYVLLFHSDVLLLSLGCYSVPA